MEKNSVKTALITGASRGIGLSIAEVLAQNGYHLILTCKNSFQQLQSISLELAQKYQILCQAYQTDMSDANQVANLFEHIATVDVLVNNAGISHVGLLADMTDTQWQEIISVNLSSCFYTCKYCIPKMLQNHSGKIINISSIWGNVGASMEVAYSASKGGVNAFTKALAKELAPSNITVNAIACGVIDTAMNACFSKEDMEALTAEIPANRIGSPQEVAQFVLQLANAPSYMTGQIITMDGGLT